MFSPPLILLSPKFQGYIWKYGGALNSPRFKYAWLPCLDILMNMKSLLRSWRSSSSVFISKGNSGWGQLKGPGFSPPFSCLWKNASLKHMDCGWEVSLLCLYNFFLGTWWQSLLSARAKFHSGSADHSFKALQNHRLLHLLWQVAILPLENETAL